MLPTILCFGKNCCYPSNTRDKWWDWEFKLQSIINKQVNREGYAIEYQRETEGLMMIETQLHG